MGPCSIAGVYRPALRPICGIVCGGRAGDPDGRVALENRRLCDARAVQVAIAGGLGVAVGGGRHGTWPRSRWRPGWQLGL